MQVLQQPTPKLTAAVLTESIAFGSDVTAASLLICWIRAGTGSTAVVTDSLGDDVPWVNISGFFGAGPNDKSFWAKIAGLGGPCTVTVTASPSGTIRMLVAEYAGAAIWKDQPVVTAVNTTNTLQSVGPTASLQAGDLVLCGSCSGIASVVVSAGASPPNSDLHKLDNNANGHIAVEDDLNWAGGAATGTFGMAPTSTSDLFIVGFKPVVNTILVPTQTHPDFGPF